MSGSIVNTVNHSALEPKGFIYEDCALFALGDVVHHRQYGYRGLIFDVDAVFCQSDEWYEMMASSHPPKDIPWYHIMVDGEEHTTYVPQHNLLLSKSDNMEIEHPLVKQFFQRSSGGALSARKLLN